MYNSAMPYANKADKLRHDADYYAKNKPRKQFEARRRYYENRPLIRKARLRIAKTKRQQLAAASRLYYKKLKSDVHRAYGGRCSCCGEDEPLFLEIDHIDSGGSKHRKEIGFSSRSLYNWIRKNNYPKENFRILCSNCNQGRNRNGGICPHVSGARMEVKS